VSNPHQQKLEEVGAGDYFTRFRYLPTTRTFEPDKVPVFCTCESPYNPDYFMARRPPAGLRVSGGGLWVCGFSPAAAAALAGCVPLRRPPPLGLLLGSWGR